LYGVCKEEGDWYIILDKNAKENRWRKSPMLVKWQIEGCMGIKTDILMRRIPFMYHAR
jgi:hypothetical protein